jgi:hypothetical protein
LSAGDVNRDVEASEPLHGFIHQVANIIFVTNIGTNKLGFGAEFAQFRD